MADTLDNALNVLQDKLKPINECQRIELIEEKGVLNDTKRNHNETSCTKSSS